ncbi:MAG: lipopolysaccharide biosynthesis protein [Sphingomonas bacterium]|nr:lipopolysaccharide biosynthesis protein [Sphingomonas bacterium]
MIDAQDNQQAGGFGWVINHLPAILWQRRLYILFTFLLFLIGATIAAFSLPTLYRSSATLLVEPQDLPQNVAQDPDGGAIGERIAKIREKVLSRGDLIALIEQNDLYPDERRSEPMSEIIKKMREATTVGALASDIGKSSTTSDVIALNMSFDYSDPEKARDVMQGFVSSFLRIDSDNLEDQASLAVRFLQDQSVKLTGQVRTIENQITILKARNGAALSGMSSMPFLDTGSYSAQIVALEAQNRELLREANRPAQRDTPILAAEAALAAAQAQYSDRHPDVVAARERLQALRRVAPSGGDSNGSLAIVSQMRDNNAAIASLRAAKSGAMASANASMSGQARAPAILEEASQLENRASVLRDQLKTVSDELLKAQNSSRMTNEQRAARLSLIEPPDLPDQPQWPNRPLIIGGGAFLGLALGFLLAMVIEFIARPLRSPAQIEAMNMPVLGIVPDFKSQTKKRRTWRDLMRREVKVG